MTRAISRPGGHRGSESQPFDISQDRRSKGPREEEDVRVSTTKKTEAQKNLKGKILNALENSGDRFSKYMDAVTCGPSPS